MATQRSIRKKKLAPKQERAKETVAIIIEATAKVLVKKGYSGATTNHIAEAAGVSIGSFYRYFKNKDLAVRALLEYETKRAEALLVGELSKPEITTLGAMTERAVATIFNFFCDHFAVWNVFYHELPREGASQLLTEHFNECAKIIEAFLVAHESEVKVSDKSLASLVVVHSTVGAFFGTDQKLKQKEKRDFLLREIQDLVFVYLFAGRSR